MNGVTSFKLPAARYEIRVAGHWSWLLATFIVGTRAADNNDLCGEDKLFSAARDKTENYWILKARGATKSRF
jgi:hypothetical protein